MTEEYVMFTTAKLLNEAGFDAPCRGVYVTDRTGYYEFREYDNKQTKDDLCWNTDDGFQYEYLAPTQALAARWLREVYNIAIYSLYDDDIEQWFYVVDAFTKNPMINGFQSGSEYDDYESAFEDGLREAVKLIKKQ
jgi:hypothetical protein